LDGGEHTSSRHDTRGNRSLSLPHDLPDQAAGADLALDQCFQHFRDADERDDDF
jgi:hypothetical protein